MKTFEENMYTYITNNHINLFYETICIFEILIKRANSFYFA